MCVTIIREEWRIIVRTILSAISMLLLALPAFAQAPRTVFAELGSATW
jgi:hypothetical protein